MAPLLWRQVCSWAQALPAIAETRPDLAVDLRCLVYFPKWGMLLMAKEINAGLRVVLYGVYRQYLHFLHCKMGLC